MDGVGPSGSGEVLKVKDGDDFKIKGAASRTLKNDRSKTASLDDCTICLQPITERAVAVPCNHLSFDFICLASWLQQRDTCPLCNSKVSVVQYDWRGPNDYKSLTIEPRQTDQKRAQRNHQVSARTGRLHGRGRPSNDERSADDTRDPLHIDPAVEVRRRVYRSGLYSFHIGANRISGYHDFTPQDFNSSSILQRRARIFLRRELQVFTYLDSQRGVRSRDFVLEFIVAMMKKFDPKAADGRAEDLLSEFLPRASARLLLHELLAWLRSPYATLVDWDADVQYSSGHVEPSTKGVG